jgi:glycosyltransferase involved in cell wall biosynthesis
VAPLIPKRIIQTGKIAPQTLRVQAMVSNIQLLNPDFEYLFFDNPAVERFIDTEFPQYRSIFDGFTFPIQRYDFFRYLAVYRYGGFYLDLDVLLASGLSPLIDYGCVFSFEGLTYSRFLRDQYGMDWEIGNYAFGAAAGHPFLQAVIENCIRAQNDPTWVDPMLRDVPQLSKEEFFVLYTTGPGMVSRTLAEQAELGKTVKVLFPENVCDLTSWNHFGEIGVHMMDATWRLNKGRLRRRLAGYLEIRKLRRLIKENRALGKTREHNYLGNGTAAEVESPDAGQTIHPLVSILIPAYNAEEWIADTLRSAISQTWNNTEIIVVDDGSTDRTFAIAREFEKEGVHVLRQDNQGAAAARNTAYSLCHGDYIQWLDADDLLAPEKISKQMELAKGGVGKLTALSAEYGTFMYRPDRSQFNSSALWCSLTPAEWLLRKMGQNLYMQTATWMISRELAEAAGPWDPSLFCDDDGEYFCRVLLASDGVRFCPDAKVYYRSFGFDSLSYVSNSAQKLEAHWRSMKLHIRYLRLMEDSGRVNAACLQYLRNWLICYYPEWSEIVEEVQQIAMELGEPIGTPTLSWKYSWMRRIFGWGVAKTAQRRLRRLRWLTEKRWEKFLLAFARQADLKDRTL